MLLFIRRCSCSRTMTLSVIQKTFGMTRSSPLIGLILFNSLALLSSCFHFLISLFLRMTVPLLSPRCSSLSKLLNRRSNGSINNWTTFGLSQLLVSTGRLRVSQKKCRRFTCVRLKTLLTLRRQGKCGRGRSGRVISRSAAESTILTWLRSASVWRWSLLQPPSSRRAFSESRSRKVLVKPRRLTFIWFGRKHLVSIGGLIGRGSLESPSTPANSRRW